MLATIKQVDERTAIDWDKATHSINQVRLDRRLSQERMREEQETRYI